MRHRSKATWLLNPNWLLGLLVACVGAYATLTVESQTSRPFVAPPTAEEPQSLDVAMVTIDSAELEQRVSAFTTTPQVKAKLVLTNHSDNVMITKLGVRVSFFDQSGAPLESRNLHPVLTEYDQDTLAPKGTWNNRAPLIIANPPRGWDADRTVFEVYEVFD